MPTIAISILHGDRFCIELFLYLLGKMKFNKRCIRKYCCVWTKYLVNYEWERIPCCAWTE